MAGRLHLTFRYRHRLFDANAAALFADRYLAALEDLIESAPSKKMAS